MLSLRGLINSFDLCFIQEHWLHHDHLHRINNVSPDFLSVSISGMESGVLLQGRPYGGCSILYRKSLSSFVSPLRSCSNRFCGVLFVDSNGVSYLLVCVYMPSRGSSSACSDYLNTPGELQGFIASHHYDVLLIVGDFNVDFDRACSFHSVIVDFMSELDLVASDLTYRSFVGFTYEGPQGSSTSWIDHVLCSSSHSAQIIDVFSLRSGTIMSDHLPLCFSLAVKFSNAHSSSSTPRNVSPSLDWSKATEFDKKRLCSTVADNIPSFPICICDCTSLTCSGHCCFLDSFAQDLVNVLHASSQRCIPSRSASTHRKLAGWSPKAKVLKRSCNFWYKVWYEAGFPSSGVLYQIKKLAKTHFKYEARRLKRGQEKFLKCKLASLFAKKKKSSFWSTVKSLNRRSTGQADTVDGVSGERGIANLMASKLENILNTHPSVSRDQLSSSVNSLVSSSKLADIHVTEDEVIDAILSLKPHKSDASGMSTELLKCVIPIVTKPLAALLTASLRHGYIPKCFRDSVVLPIPKSGKNASVSDNYRPISLTSNFSKIIEYIILEKYSNYFTSNVLQFGFKAGSSTSLCTGLVKNIVSRYIHNGSNVLGCFLDASKSFDLVDHGELFSKLLQRGLPYPIVRFLVNWYSSQRLKVRWGNSLSDPIGVSNGVRQGSVLSPVLFSVYLDDLLEDLSQSGVGRYWGHMFAGALCYADDLVLLAPCASALRRMLSICSYYARDHGLLFNPCKTQLMFSFH